MICYTSYEQEDLPFGEEEVIICNEPDKVTQDDMGSYYLVETCVFANEDDVATNNCEWQCTTAFEDKPEDEEEGCNTPPCSPGFELDEGCNCKEVPPKPCSVNYGEEYYQTQDCGCAPYTPPSCRVPCSPGYTLVNCNCVPSCPTSCPVGYTKINCNCVATQPDPNPDPCAETVNDIFKGLTKHGKMEEIFSKFYGPNAQFKINIISDSLGGDTDLAQTSNSGVFRTYNITFNSDFSNATSLIHEYIHANFKTLYDDWQNDGNIHAFDDYPALKSFYTDETYPSSYSKDAHHEAIATSFIDLMAEMIQEYQTNTPVLGSPNQFYIDLAWSSLQGTPAYFNGPLNQADRDRIGYIRTAEVNNLIGSYSPIGTPCN